MTAKSKSQSESKAKNRTLVAATIIVPIVVAVFASPLPPAIVDYFKKAPAAETTTPATATEAPSTATAAPVSSENTIQQDCLKKAWDAFNATKYENAIKFADQCIDEFGKAAEREQKRLEDTNTSVPPPGKVTSAEKSTIMARGPLNDVATAFYIKGRSAEYLYRKGGAAAATYKKTAEETYEATCRFKYARTWDNKGWFWSPCEAASERLPLK